MSNYNGWKNRQTWLVNVHFGDYFQELKEEGTKIDAEFIREFVDEHFQQQVKDLSMFVQDLIDDAGIDWDELAAHYATPFHVVGIDEDDGSATVLEEFDHSSDAIDWARRYVSNEDAGGWKHVEVLDTREECAETVWRWEAV